MTQEESPVEWQEALDLLQAGDIVFAGQSHGLTVRLTDAAGKRFVTTEPEIDAILKAVEALPPETRDRIAVMTE
jgi:hypothetical protein